MLSLPGPEAGGLVLGGVDPQVRKFVQERALAALPGARNALAV